MIQPIKQFFKTNLYILLLLFIALITLTGCTAISQGMLNPAGLIATAERKLFFNTLALMLIVVLPVIVMSLTFVYHYRLKNTLAEYQPNWHHSFFLEGLWWGIPCTIIFVLAVLTWKKTHELDPYRKIIPTQQAVFHIQVIALPWKWLFIYPDYNIATINYLVIPVDQQIQFDISADNVPMSAFFIPQLGSQIYAMAGMKTKLNLITNRIGEYRGLNTQYNGNGYSDMYFNVIALPSNKVQHWITYIEKHATPLTISMYYSLLTPSIKNQATQYAGIPTDLFNTVVNTYMHSKGPNHPRQSLTINQSKHP